MLHRLTVPLQGGIMYLPAGYYCIWLFMASCLLIRDCQIWFFTLTPFWVFLFYFFFFFLPQLDSNYISVAPFFDGWNTRQCSRPSRMWRHTAPPRLLLSSYGAATVAAADRGKVAPFRGNYQPKMVEINCVTLDETEITTLSAMMTFIGGRKLMVRRTGEVGAPGPGAGRPIYHGSGPRLRDK